MRDDFGIFILTHGRPDRVITAKMLEKQGYTGQYYLVVDDEDKDLPRYQRRFGAERVLVFSKAEVAKIFDEADNTGSRGSVVYARNACWGFARRLGLRFFLQLDDDYSSFHLRFDAEFRYVATNLKFQELDAAILAMLEFFEATPSISTLAMSQGGDHIGGGGDGRQRPRLTRKAMNTFFCDTERPFMFHGRVNEDVNTYVAEGRKGGLFLTAMQAQMNQGATQSNAGGMTDLYVDSGTYVKSFYSVMYAPSCVKIGTLEDPRSPHARLHHSIDWRRAVPKIVSEDLRKAR